jgi:alanyl-tRNA synthetase
MDQARAVLKEASEMLGVWPLLVPKAAQVLADHIRDLKKQLAGGKPAEKPATDVPAEGESEPPYSDVKAALKETARLLNVKPFDVPARLEALTREGAKLSKQLREQDSAETVTAESLLAEAQEVGGVKVIVAETPGGNPNQMRQLIDQLRKTAAPCAVLLAVKLGDSKVVLVAGLTKDLVEKGLSAGKWVGQVAKVVGGGGGGKPDMAQAGGKNPEKLPEAIEEAKNVISGQLA